MAELTVKDRVKQNRITSGYKSNRNSSIELLKIFAIALIIVSHVVQTITDKNTFIDYNDYIINLKAATIDVQYFILIILRHGGIIGNNIFFICSAWYLVNSNKNNVQKIMQMIMDVWVISMLWLCFTKCDGTVAEIDKTLLIKSFFPITFSNNWYITEYIVFCFFHLAINKYIELLDKRLHFRICLSLTMMYIVIGTISYYVDNGYAFHGSVLTLWITMYFVISYIRKYDIKAFDNKIFNILITVIGLTGLIVLLIITNKTGLNGDFSKNRMLNWNTNSNLFALMLCFGLFNLARNKKFSNQVVNYISSLSLLIYIIHENILCRYYYRPPIWQSIYTNYGYNNVVLWALLLTVLIFVVSLALASIYKFTLQRLVISFSKIITPVLGRIYMSLENKIIK